MANGLFKGNATYFGRKGGSIEDVVEKINQANPKPEVFDIKKEANEYQMLVKKELEKTGKSLGDMSDQEKKDFFNNLDKKYKAKGEQMDDKAQSANQSQVAKDGEEKSKVKKSVNETVRDMLLKAWKQAAQMAEETHKDKKDKKEKSEKVDEPYAVGMAQAMKQTGDKPPLKKSTITKAHDIAKSIEKSEK